LNQQRLAGCDKDDEDVIGDRVGESTSSADRRRRRWQFADAILDERSLELIVNGVDAELERKPLEVLIYLLQRAGEVCTKDELLAGVWPGRILSETVLTKCIGRLRDVLGDKDQDIIKTAYGFGYRFVAAVRVEYAPAPEPVRFDFRAGDHPPGRPLWNLVERLGIGGHGEAWRGRHEKTHEQRVFKFALDEASLGALKREITLFRIINDSLEERARIVKLLDWNLEQVPYFTEAEYVTGGSLIDWAKGRGGIGAIPIPERLEVVAKIAAALAAVHSVGVLHKDLKPSNVLVKPVVGQAIDVALADFGSGGVLDGDHLERLGITRLGFTKTIAASEASSGTPMYLAPEILAGQPFTVKSDIYALGVILYQFLTGDFHKLMSPGWERDIEDELLRDDIALVAEGNPVMRLADADVLAQRLRTLDKRRDELAAQREALAKAERARRLLERVRARRFGLMLAFVALVAGLVTSTALYFRARHAQEKAEEAAAQSNSVTAFLSQDVFAPVSSDTESVRDLTVLDLLRRAGDDVDLRFARQPKVASQLHYIIGRSFETFFDDAPAVNHFNRALELGENLDGEGSESALRSAAELIRMDYAVGKLQEDLPRYEGALEAGKKRFGTNAAIILDLRLKLARGYYLLGEWTQSKRAFESLLTDSVGSGTNSELVGRLKFHYGQLLTDLFEPIDAQKQFRAAIELLTSSLGEKHSMVAEAHAALGRSLADMGQYNQAKTELDKAQQMASQWAPRESWTEIRPRFYTALMWLHEDEPAKAEPILSEIIAYQDANQERDIQAHKGLAPVLDHTGTARQALGEAFARQGKISDAIAVLRRAVEVIKNADGSQHPSLVSAQLSLAEALIAGDRYAEAQATLAAISPSVSAALPLVHPTTAQLRRVQGLLALRHNDLLEARTSLGRASEIYHSLYGPTHWRSIRADQEFARIPRDGTG
jgi:serine/threonine protein kinase/DNA-binding winged helix-turn-helix (wHTH) protein